MTQCKELRCSNDVSYNISKDESNRKSKELQQQQEMLKFGVTKSGFYSSCLAWT
jgi:hypothetical protein